MSSCLILLVLRHHKKTVGNLALRSTAVNYVLGQRWSRPKRCDPCGKWLYHEHLYQALSQFTKLWLPSSLSCHQQKQATNHQHWWTLYTHHYTPWKITKDIMSTTTLLDSFQLVKQLCAAFRRSHWPDSCSLPVVFRFCDWFMLTFSFFLNKQRYELVGSNSRKI